MLEEWARMNLLKQDEN